MVPTFRDNPSRNQVIHTWLKVHGKGLGGNRYKTRALTFASACGATAWIREEYGGEVAQFAATGSAIGWDPAVRDAFWRLLDEVVGPLVQLVKELSTAALPPVDDATAGAARWAREKVREKVRDGGTPKAYTDWIVRAALPGRRATEQLLAERTVPPDVAADALAAGLFAGRQTVWTAPEDMLTAADRDRAVALLDEYAARHELVIVPPPLPADAAGRIRAEVEAAVHALPRTMAAHSGLVYAEVVDYLETELRYDRPVDALRTMKFYIGKRSADEYLRVVPGLGGEKQLELLEAQEYKTPGRTPDVLFRRVRDALARRRSEALGHDAWTFDAVEALLDDPDNPVAAAASESKSRTAFRADLLRAAQQALDASGVRVPAGLSRDVGAELVRRRVLELLTAVLDADSALRRER